MGIANRDNILHLFQTEQFDYLINCAAITNLEQAENIPDLAYKVNAHSLQFLGEAAKEHKKFIIHLSTNYVYDGEQSGSYNETDIPNPTSIYAKSKLLGEKKLLEAAPNNSIILRLSWVFSEYDGCNFLMKILSRLKNKSVIEVVDDQFGCPTAAKHVAIIIEKLAIKLQNNDGFGEIYNYCDSPSSNWYAYADNIIHMSKLLGIIHKDIILNPVSTSSYVERYKIDTDRPINGEMNCDKLCMFLGIEPYNWQNGLIPVIAKIKKNKLKIDGFMEEKLSICA